MLPRWSTSLFDRCWLKSGYKEYHKVRQRHENQKTKPRVKTRIAQPLGIERKLPPTQRNKKNNDTNSTYRSTYRARWFEQFRQYCEQEYRNEQGQQLQPKT